MPVCLKRNFTPPPTVAIGGGSSKQPPKGPRPPGGGGGGKKSGGGRRRTGRDKQFNRKYRAEVFVAFDELSFKTSLSLNEIVERAIILLQMEFAKTHAIAHAFDEAACARAKAMLPVRQDGRRWWGREGAWQAWVEERRDDGKRPRRKNGLPDRRHDRRTGRVVPLNLKQSQQFCDAVYEMADLVGTCDAAIIEKGIELIRRKFSGTLECHLSESADPTRSEH